MVFSGLSKQTPLSLTMHSRVAQDESHAYNSSAEVMHTFMLPGNYISLALTMVSLCFDWTGPLYSHFDYNGTHALACRGAAW